MSINILDENSINSGFYFVCVGAFFIMLSLSTHLPAYPHMLEQFNLNAGYAVWMQLGLAVGLTGFQPLLGWIGDSFGLKLVLLLGGLFMILGSLLVAFAAFITIGAVFGPLISGSIVDGFNWQMSFIFTAVLGVLSFLLFLGVPYVSIDKRPKLDIGGVVFVIILLLGLLTIPTFINTYGFSSGMWLPSFGVFVIALILLIVVERKQETPLIDIRYITNKVFWVPTL